jgi:phosphatidylserine/phosphatidylglycerophosphate/cardiolipin synthase-like enzyme
LTATGSVRGVFFSLGTTPSSDPQLDRAKAIIDLFAAAKKTAHVAIYTLTESGIVDAMIAARKRGVKVAVVTDASESDPNKNPFQAQLIHKLVQGGVDVHVATRQTALMHNKVGIFDGQTVCTGSFNWTNQAEKMNDENLVVLDGVSVAAAYEKYVFQRILKNETLPGPVHSVRLE